MCNRPLTHGADPPETGEAERYQAFPLTLLENLVQGFNDPRAMEELQRRADQGNATAADFLKRTQFHQGLST